MSPEVIDEIIKEMNAIKISVMKECGKIDTLKDIWYRNGIIEGIGTLQKILDGRKVMPKKETTEH